MTGVGLAVRLRLDELARLFQLSELEVGILLLCLAPELDLRYERLYAYLQDNVTHKRPTVELALTLLCASFEASFETGFEAKLAGRRAFLPGSPLVRQGLIHVLADPTDPKAHRLSPRSMACRRGLVWLRW